MFFNAGYQSGQNERKANVEAAHYATNTAYKIERECGTKTGQSARKCITEVVKTEREETRGESDLAAQWEAAEWVRLAGVAALAQLIATVIGLYFLKGTLDATLKAVEDTGKATVAMEASNAISAQSAAAFLSKERGRLRFGQQQISTIAGAKYLPFKIENTGHTECSLIEIHYTISDHPVWLQPTICANMRSFVPSKTEEIIEDVNSDILTGHNAGYIAGFILYDGIAGIKYSAYFCYRFWRIGENDICFEWADCEGLPRDT